MDGAQIAERRHGHRLRRRVQRVLQKLATAGQARQQVDQRLVDLLGHALAGLALEHRARYHALAPRVLELGHLVGKRLVGLHQS